MPALPWLTTDVMAQIVMRATETRTGDSIENDIAYYRMRIHNERESYYDDPTEERLAASIDKIRLYQQAIDDSHALVLRELVRLAVDGYIVASGYPSPKSKERQIVPPREWGWLHLNIEGARAEGNGLVYVGLRYVIVRELDDEARQWLEAQLDLSDAPPRDASMSELGRAGAEAQHTSKRKLYAEAEQIARELWRDHEWDHARMTEYLTHEHADAQGEVPYMNLSERTLRKSLAELARELGKPVRGDPTKN